MPVPELGSLPRAPAPQHDASRGQPVSPSAKRPVVLVYRHELLRSSETFIREQGESLRGFVPHYVGARRLPGLSLPSERTSVLRGEGTLGRVADIFGRLTGTVGSRAPELERLEPALIHAHFGPDGVAALPLSRLLGVPLIVTFHGYDATTSDEHARRSSLRQALYVRRRSELAARASLFLAVSQFVKGRLIAQGFPEDRIVVHYIGVDTDSFQSSAAREREPVVLFVARLVEQKGCEHLIRAMELVQRAHPEVELVVIGEGPQRKSLEAKAAACLTRYRFLGVQPPEEVRSWMRRARVFCVPSITMDSGAEEGFGIVFAEAQAAELPVVSYASGGIPEAVGHGETGFLAPEGDWQGLAAHLQTLLGSVALERSFGVAGRDRVMARFDLRSQTAMLEEIYDGVIRRGRRSP